LQWNTTDKVSARTVHQSVQEGKLGWVIDSSQTELLWRFSA